MNVKELVEQLQLPYARENKGSTETLRRIYLRLIERCYGKRP